MGTKGKMKPWSSTLRKCLNIFSYSTTGICKIQQRRRNWELKCVCPIHQNLDNENTTAGSLQTISTNRNSSCKKILKSVTPLVLFPHANLHLMYLPRVLLKLFFILKHSKVLSLQRWQEWYRVTGIQCKSLLEVQSMPLKRQFWKPFSCL